MDKVIHTVYQKGILISLSIQVFRNGYDMFAKKKP